MQNPDWVLGIDFETTGLDPDNDKDVPIEIGAVLWDWPNKKPLAIISENVILEAPRSLSSEIQTLTGIRPDMLVAPLAVPESQAMIRVLELAASASYIMAHNAKFDLSFFRHAIARNFLEMPTLDWIDTIADVPYPPGIKARALSYLAADHKFLNPFAHRAVFDVLTMFTVAGNYPLADIVAMHRSPTVRLVGTFPRTQNEAAKACGFRWDPDRREWYREVKASQISTLKIDVSYSTTEAII